MGENKREESWKILAAPSVMQNTKISVIFWEEKLATNHYKKGSINIFKLVLSTFLTSSLSINLDKYFGNTKKTFLDMLAPIPSNRGHWI